ncbi:MAG: type I phosphomannose isomerase catalytic subunit [Clostridia bacterium]
MNIRFSIVKENQLAEICALYQDVISDMRARGLKQWEWETYPTQEQLEAVVEAGQLYCAADHGQLAAAFALSGTLDEEYARLSWMYGVKPATLHLLAMRHAYFGTELAAQALDFGKGEAKRLGYDSLRMDTCREDERMLALFKGQMTREAGSITFEDNALAYACFEAPLSEHCPMLPIRMHPAYRFGEMTPWGGEQLRSVYHKQIPDERTGEALEISAIPKLESVSDAGETLGELIAKNGARLTGKGAEEEFPLLLKLLAAREPLSVQVHPGDAYAKEHEHKLGKTEAWVILNAEPGASILYGMKEGVTLDGLREALKSGEDIEPMIERVNVQNGDVFYMPSGMVHAIGAGILLYEIQQSSDVTYRLWDYNRRNAAGEKRPLHITQSLDVIDLGLHGARARMPEVGGNELVNLLRVPAFGLDCACVNGELELEANAGGFRMVTALAGLLLSWQGDAMELNAGDSVLLPAMCPAVTLMGVGRALIAGR